MNYYRYYDSILKTEAVIKTLQNSYINKSHNLPLIEFEVYINKYFEYLPSQTADISDYGEYLSLSICGDPVYHIYKNNKLIKAFSRDIKYIEDSIINLPASVLCFTCNKLLLHCSSVLINNNAYAFIGNKGLGKTTFSILLSEYYKLLSDDTLMVCGLDNNGEIEVMPSQTLSKISPQTMENFKERISMTSNFKLNSKKYLCRIANSVMDEDGVQYRLKGLILLNRTNNDKISANIIRMQSTRKLLILKNIVGIQYFPYEYRSIINNSSLSIALSNLKTFSLSIPNGIHNLKHLKNEYIKFLDSIGGKA
jgi:hypothetical protein